MVGRRPLSEQRACVRGGRGPTPNWCAGPWRSQATRRRSGSHRGRPATEGSTADSSVFRLSVDAGAGDASDHCLLGVTLPKSTPPLPRGTGRCEEVAWYHRRGTVHSSPVAGGTTSTLWADLRHAVRDVMRVRHDQEGDDGSSCWLEPRRTVACRVAGAGAAPARRRGSLPRVRPRKGWAPAVPGGHSAGPDRGCRAEERRRALRKRRIKARIARRGVASKERLGRYRWVIERTLAWLNTRFRRLRIRYERHADIHQAFLSLGCAMICWNYIIRPFC